MLTQGTIHAHFTRPRVFLVPKGDPTRMVHLFDVENFAGVTTGFTYSLASRVAKDGVFFTFRGGRDVFDGGPSLLKWRVRFD